MLKVKIKTEKPDIEGTGARGRLDAVLQGLVEKSDNNDRDQNEDDPGKATTDSLSKDLSPSSVGKRPSARFPQHRRKKRKEMDDSIAESNQHKQNAYIIKLFDRSVDLAQFSTSTPLYPICRAWMRNNPTVRDQSSSLSPPQSMSDEEVVDMINGKSQTVYRLPPPTTCPVNSSGDPVNLRIPPIVKASPTEGTDAAANATPLIYNHMARWKKIRQKWKESSNKNQLRYAESIKILKDMYDR
ncbi:protein lin-37 homolog [Alosa alosa]|nr:protein lin-37 homolog [Alosa sapidissima]XP_041961849.1 protein lin-37 homolog [Alosa sapidissima]XP_041961850.1 protein lin-37 homolog [Alosa sapidissima]XP_041961851.1 protein lin-37 homolog [Alosa sapidissima]XP_041961852.1 protein lin-37 homolog [Alosa sapidissima]XP_048116357.1 protein lin-37 homolog [Alosa alosa]XP_048116358.1 protein lin-37 homolog [Alosa alosa]XP_048116359.1 protein lin-37 homolog [Alosa alosa]XP_048116360.1 protein lin-37 homolog [Alosa alosa]XP_048116361.1 pr